MTDEMPDKVRQLRSVSVMVTLQPASPSPYCHLRKKSRVSLTSGVLSPMSIAASGPAAWPAGRASSPVLNPDRGFTGGYTMKVTGRCHCGNISFEAEIDPAQVRVCHCTDCQHLTGTAFRSN